MKEKDLFTPQGKSRYISQDQEYLIEKDGSRWVAFVRSVDGESVVYFSLGSYSTLAQAKLSVQPHLQGILMPVTVRPLKYAFSSGDWRTSCGQFLFAKRYKKWRIIPLSHKRMNEPFSERKSSWMHIHGLNQEFDTRKEALRALERAQELDPYESLS